MKKAISFILLLGSMAIFIGCPKDPEEKLEPPSNLSIEVAGADSLSLKLSWKASPTEKIDGYIIYLGDSPIDTVAKGVTTDIDTPKTLGDYRVRAYRGKEMSDFSNTVSTKLVEVSGQTIYRRGVDIRKSAYGWNTANGQGSIYPTDSAHATDIDLILDNDMTLSCPRTVVGWAKNRTAIRSIGITWGIDTVPRGEYGNAMRTDPHTTGVLKIRDGKYFLKLEVTAQSDAAGSVTFRYGFQPIRGFRRLK